MALHSWSRSGVAVLAGMLVASAAAQTPEALEQRLREHPSLRALDYQAAQFREASTVAAAIPDPVVSLGVNNVPVNDPAFDRFLPSNRALGIQQSIPNGARRAANSQAPQRTAVQLQVRYRAQLSSLRGELLALLHDRQRILDEIEQADDPEFIPRAKPLREVPEREVALYAHLRELPAHIAECPHADRSFRGEIQTLLHDLEDRHPGTRHSIMAGYEKLAGLAATEYDDDNPELEECENCGSPTTGDICRKCGLLDALGAV